MEARRHEGLKEARTKNYPGNPAMNSYFFCLECWLGLPMCKMEVLARDGGIWNVSGGRILLKLTTSLCMLPIFLACVMELNAISSFPFYLLFYLRYFGWCRNLPFDILVVEFPDRIQIVLRKKGSFTCETLVLKLVEVVNGTFDCLFLGSG